MIKFEKPKLKNEYKNLDELKKDVPKDFGIWTTSSLVVIAPNEVDANLHPGNYEVVFNIKEDKIQKVDVARLRKELVKVLTPHITVEKLVEDALECQTAYDLQEIYERAVLKKGKIKEEEGCYKLLIGGKRGHPFEFMLRE